MTIQHNPIDKEILEHVNNYYEVVFIPEGERFMCKDVDGEEVEGNYEVRNRKYGCCEYRSINLPSALAVAEQFNAMLVDKVYIQETEDDMFVQLDHTSTGTVQ